MKQFQNTQHLNIWLPFHHKACQNVGNYTVGLLCLLGLNNHASAESFITSKPPAIKSQMNPPRLAQPNMETRKYLALGNVYYNTGRYDLAFVAFKEATVRDPQNKKALLGLGRSQIKVRSFDEAIQTLNQLVSIDARNVSAYIALAHALQQQYVAALDRKDKTSNLEKAIMVLDQAEDIASNQETPQRDISLSKVYNERGYIYNLQKKLPKAAASYQKASQLNPTESLIRYNLGEIYEKMGEKNKALSVLQQAVLINPKDAYNRAYYARLLANHGQFDAAKPEAAEAVRLAPENAYTVGQFGIVRYLAGEPALARIKLNNAVKLAPLKYPEFYFFLGKIDLDSKDIRGARAHLTKAVILGSTVAEYAYYLGLSYERSSSSALQDKDKARRNYQRAIQLNPKHQMAQRGLSRLK